MPAALTYPGVYIEEISSGVRTITGVATSITAFIGRAKKGPVNKATTINNFGDYERIFGGLDLNSMMSYSVRDFYLNGGSQAVIVRLYRDDFMNNGTDETAAAALRKIKKEEADAAANAVVNAVNEVKDFEKIINAAANAAEHFTSNHEKKSAEYIVERVKSIIQNNSDLEKIKKAVQESVNAANVVAVPPAKTSFSIGNIKLEAAYEGSWGAALRAIIEPVNDDNNKIIKIHLTVTDVLTGSVEKFMNLSFSKDDTRRIDKILKSESKLVRSEEPSISDITLSEAYLAEGKKTYIDSVSKKGEELSEKGKALIKAKDALENAKRNGVSDLSGFKEKVKEAQDALKTAQGGVKTAQDELKASDGKLLEATDILISKTNKEGLYALEDIDIFNLLCIPPYSGSDANGNPTDVDSNVISEAAAYCEKRRAMLLVDSPSAWKDKEGAKEIKNTFGGISKNAALFFPRLMQSNPLRGGQVEEFVPCGAVAGVIARTDSQRGIWKAPAGTEATLRGVSALSVELTNDENGELNPLGINCLRTFPNVGKVVWGARTLRGADILADEWKYLPVRRTALYIEESLYRGTQWVVFEPNDEPLWAQIRLNVGAFMHNLFRKGAFQGTTPKEAYFVKCDKETTTQNDIDLGIVNIVVGFAPLKPAEFVVIKLQQIAGDLQV